MCYIDERDYFHLLEMVALHLCKIQSPEWRWYGLPTALPPFCQDIKANNLTVQVPNNKLSNYATNLVKELMQPLRISVQHHSHGPGDLATIILSETILSLLPTMSVKDMPYWLLRSYQIMPLHPATMAGHKQQVEYDNIASEVDGVFHIEVPQLERIFLPLQDYSDRA